MKTHKFYYFDSTGSTDGAQRKVRIDRDNNILKIASLKIPLPEIVCVEIRHLEGNPKLAFLAIDVCGPTIENGELTTIAMASKNFWGQTVISKMEEFVEEILPLLHDENLQSDMGEGVAPPEGLLQAQYALNISLTIAFYRKLWFAYDKPATIAFKSLMLMVVAGFCNTVGILLIMTPFDNLHLAANLRKVGWPSFLAISTYLLLTFPGHIITAYLIYDGITKG